MKSFMIYIQKSVFFLVLRFVSFFGGRRVWWDAKKLSDCPKRKREKEAKKGGTPEKKGTPRKKRKRKKEPPQTCWPR